MEVMKCGGPMRGISFTTGGPTLHRVSFGIAVRNMDIEL